MPRRDTLIVALLVVSSLAAIGGVVLAATARATAAFGWFAYAPLSGQVFTPGIGVPPAVIGGLALAAVGLLGVGFGAGWLVSARRRDP
ncbi:hypothetical protein [Microbacterium sp. BK668]|uniref:hypothetical protein n=1 Tax=Microbacterium sp. BK668 TaxID=2512118 RepID=UPI00105B9F39|nr:hypothetical protein [Microbacterium sp. BK668]TDN87812.1 hypothetical protein EV279_3245 [Microbacterium sp. BK668]